MFHRRGSYRAFLLAAPDDDRSNDGENSCSGFHGDRSFDEIWFVDEFLHDGLIEVNNRASKKLRWEADFGRLVERGRSISNVLLFENERSPGGHRGLTALDCQAKKAGSEAGARAHIRGSHPRLPRMAYFSEFALRIQGRRGTPYELASPL